MGPKPSCNSTRSKTVSIFLIAWFFLGSFSLIYAQEPSQTKPKKEDYNVILIIISTLRGSHLGCYGYSKDNSPTIDRIAQDSIIFENAFSNAGYTLPSTMSILTSLYPSSHGMFSVFKDKLSPRVKTLAEILSIYKYKTAWFSLLEEPHLDINIGFGRGFQDIVDLSLQFDGLRELISWLGEKGQDKFFLAVDTRRVNTFHRILEWERDKLKGIPEQDLKKLSDEFSSVEKFNYDKSIELIQSKKYPFDNPEIITSNPELFEGSLPGKLYEAWIENLASKHPKAYAAAYDAAIQAVDEKLIKPIYEQLKLSGVYDKTIIIITVDHGEAFGEHGFYRHGPLYPEVNRVPLIIKLPYAKEGKRTKELAQGIDILPTVLELAGIEKPYQAQGKSLVNLMTGKDTHGPNKHVFAESFNRTSMRSKEWKIELPDYDDPQYGPKKLFHLTVDPQEHKDVYSSEPQVAIRLEKELKQWKAALPSYSEDHPFDPGIDKAAQERIKRTGYF